MPVVYIDEANLNNRIYEEDIVLDIINQFKEKQPLIGELKFEHDGYLYDNSIIDLSRASHIIKNLKQEFSCNDETGESRNILTAEIQIIDNDNGRYVMSNLDKLSLSLRGTGTLQPICFMDPKTRLIEGEHLGWKVKDYELITIDLILRNESAFCDRF